MNERKTMLIYAEPTRDEIIKWANTALRNSDIGFIDESLIEDFKDGLSAFVATGQLVPAQTWQPIDTAPKDGTRILVYTYTHKTGIAWFCEQTGRWPEDEIFSEDGEPCNIGWPTHWMPLPAAPAPEVG